jgi:hypothetical protein
MSTGAPDILYCDKDERQLYDALKEEDIFRNLALKHVFMMAFAKGVQAQKRNTIKNRVPGGLIRESYLDDNERAVIRAVAISEEGKLGALLDEKKVYQIAEEFASGGIRLLKNEVCSGDFGSYSKKLGEVLKAEAEKVTPR